jgi:hypothetical protein
MWQVKIKFNFFKYEIEHLSYACKSSIFLSVAVSLYFLLNYMPFLYDFMRNIYIQGSQFCLLKIMSFFLVCYLSFDYLWCIFYMNSNWSLSFYMTYWLETLTACYIKKPSNISFQYSYAIVFLHYSPLFMDISCEEWLTLAYFFPPSLTWWPQYYIFNCPH